MRTYKQAVTKLRPYLEEHKMRPSAVRDKVLEQICQMPQPFNAEQLVEACAPEFISVATIYNALNLFVDAQILHAIQRQRGRAAVEYELTTNGSNHAQIKCLKCGRVVDIHDKAITRLVMDRTYSNFMPHNYTLVVYGECKVCRTKRKKKKITTDQIEK